MESKLKIAEGLSLPAEDFLESAVGVIGKRGKGKSGLVKVLMEELVRVRLPFVALDPVGIMWGLRSSLDGKDAGLPVLVVGGPHGDLRLDRRAGAQIARAVVQANISCIVDFSEEPKAAYREFVKDFAHELFHINDTPRMVIIEEAPELVPQKVMWAGMGETFEAVERLVSRGRNKGIGVVMVSQRAATINKDVLSQVDAMFIFGLAAPQDRKALGEWVEGHGQKDKLQEFDQHVAELEKRQAWFWAPEAFGGAFQRITVRPFHTFHPDKTHLRRMGLLESKPVTTDVQEIVAKLGQEMERLAKVKDEKASIAKLTAERDKLRVAIVHLQEATADLKARRPVAPITKPKPDPAALRAAEQRGAEAMRRVHARELAKVKAGIERAGAALAALARGLGVAGTDDKRGGDWVSALPRADRQAGHLEITSVKVLHPPIAKPEATLPPDAEIAGETDIGDRPLPAGALRMLKVLAQRFPATFTRSQIGTLAGFTASGGTFKNYFGMLRNAGFIEEDGSGNVRATDKGLDLAEEVPPAPETHEDIMAMWQRSLVSGAYRMLEHLVSIYPNPTTREALGDAAGFTFSGGTFKNYIGMLKNNNLIVADKDGTVRAADALFPER